MHMHKESETAWIEAFRDGVFAIAMMLLVIEIKVPSQEPDLSFSHIHDGAIASRLCHVGVKGWGRIALARLSGLLAGR